VNTQKTISVSPLTFNEPEDGDYDFPIDTELLEKGIKIRKDNLWGEAEQEEGFTIKLGGLHQVDKSFSDRQEQGSPPAPMGPSKLDFSMII
jgi:hypothetical protein